MDAVIPISALQGRNLRAVEDWAVAQLPEGPSLYPKASAMLEASAPTLPKSRSPVPVAVARHVLATTACPSSSFPSVIIKRSNCAWWGCAAQDVLSEHPERFFVAEIIREKIFQQYREEVPYCASVRLHRQPSLLPPSLPAVLPFLAGQPTRSKSHLPHASSLHADRSTRSRAWVVLHCMGA